MAKRRQVAVVALRQPRRRAPASGGGTFRVPRAGHISRACYRRQAQSQRDCAHQTAIQHRAQPQTQDTSRVYSRIPRISRFNLASLLIKSVPIRGSVFSFQYFSFQVSGLRFQVSGLSFQVSVFRSQFSGLRSQVSSFRSQFSLTFELWNLNLPFALLQNAR